MNEALVPVGIVSFAKTGLRGLCSKALQIFKPSITTEYAFMLQISTSIAPELIQPDQKAVIAERVRGEFREMPGLSLTLAQAQRLWSLDLSTCSEVLSQLVECGFLSQRADGAFCRASDLTARPLRMAKAAIELADLDTPRRLGQA
jgi:hypothetical protein